jgi:regulator of RNase E activity RraA
MVQKGDVLVVDWRGYVDGCGSGAQSLVVPFQHGLRGVVIDGAWRDVGELQQMGIPVFGRAVSAYSPPKTRSGEINVAVSCGGVVVAPGDLVVADGEGIAIVPRDSIRLVSDQLKTATKARDRTAEELLQRAARRAEHFRWIFDASGGVELSDPESGGS